MKRSLLGCVAAAGLTILMTADKAAAQYPQLQQNNPYYRPPVSPYVNLARGGNQAINYFGLVRPQLDFAKQLQYMQTQQGGLTPQWGIPFEEDEMMAAGPITGHPTQFLNYSHYYYNQTTGISTTPGTGLRPGQQGLPPLGVRRF